MDDQSRPPLSKAAYVAEGLRKDLINGRVFPGDALNQIEIAARYGVSATPVREALRILEADGLVVYLPHKGATVADLPRADLHDLYLFRSNVEGLTASMAAQRATPDQLGMLREIHESLKSAVATHSPEELSRLNREFHLAVMAVGSPFIATHVMRPVWERIIPPRDSMWRDPAKVQAFIEAHENIIQAIESRDSERADQLARDHISDAGSLRDARSENGQDLPQSVE